jgi:hypothetical protein
LEFGLPIPDSPPNLIDLEPVDIPKRLICLLQSVTNRRQYGFCGLHLYADADSTSPSDALVSLKNLCAWSERLGKQRLASKQLDSPSSPQWGALIMRSF